MSSILELLQAGQPAPYLVPRLRPRHGHGGPRARDRQARASTRTRSASCRASAAPRGRWATSTSTRVHTAHGRALAFATGIKLARPELKVVVMTGDGDCTAIGGNHFIHAARRNIDITTIVMNNSIYGMTSGQYSPMTPKGMYGTTAPYGNLERELRPLRAREGGGRDLRRPRDLLPRAPPHRPHRGRPPEQGLLGRRGARASARPTSGARTRSGGAVEMLEWIKDGTVNVKAARLPSPGEGRRQEAHRRAPQRARPRVHQPSTTSSSPRCSAPTTSSREGSTDARRIQTERLRRPGTPPRGHRARRGRHSRRQERGADPELRPRGARRREQGRGRRLRRGHRLPEGHRSRTTSSPLRPSPTGPMAPAMGAWPYHRRRLRAPRPGDQGAHRRRAHPRDGLGQARQEGGGQHRGPRRPRRALEGRDAGKPRGGGSNRVPRGPRTSNLGRAARGLRARATRPPAPQAASARKRGERRWATQETWASASRPGRPRSGKSLAKRPERKATFETGSGAPVGRLYTPLDLGARLPRGHRLARRVPLHAGRAADDVPGQALDDAPVRGLRHGRGIQRALQVPPAQGQTGLSIAFDLPTQIGYDSDHPLAAGEVGKVGVAVDSLADMETLFAGIPLDKVSTSMTINAPAAVLLAMYIAVAEKQGVSPKVLEGTIQNDILKEYVARGTYIFPPAPSMRLITDVFAYCAEAVPNWNTISISGYHIREAGSTASQEVAFTLADGIAYVAGGHRGRPRRRRFRAAALLLLQRAQRPLRGGRQVPSRAQALGADHARSLRRQEPQELDAALPRPDRRLDADRPAERQQRRRA